MRSLSSLLRGSAAAACFLMGSAAGCFVADDASDDFEDSNSRAVTTTASERELGSFPVDNPAFMTIAKITDRSGPSLLFSSFGVERVVLNKDAVWYVPNVAKYVSPQDPSVHNIQPRKVVDGGMGGITWPNEALPTPSGIFRNPGIVVASGFLVPVPPKSGHISYVDLTTNEVTHLDGDTWSRFGWFYHRAHFVDMNGDGRLDILTARAHKLQSAQAELLWLEQPASDPDAGHWVEHVIAKDSTDVHFELTDLDGDGVDEIVSPQYFHPKLAVFWREGDTWKSRDIDTSVTGFDVQVVDLNNDGKKDVLLSNAQHGPGSVVAYEVPEDFRSQAWTKHDVLTGTETLIKDNKNSTSPGKAEAFYSDSRDTQGKPLVLVSGDDSGKLFLLRPMSEDSRDWAYQSEVVFTSTLKDGKGTIGRTAIGDLNDDGYSELVVPAYHEGQVHIFTFAPDSK